MLVATPLIEALKNAYPDSKVSIGVGDWLNHCLKITQTLMKLFPAMLRGITNRIAGFLQTHQKLFLKDCFMCLFLRNHERSLKKSLPMALMYSVVAKVLGFYEEQESLTDLELEVMLAETIGALIAFNSEKRVR